MPESKEAGLPYGILDQKSPDWCGPLWRELDDLYVGGYAVQSRIGDYVRKLAGEHDARYQDRLQSISYISYFGQIVDYFVSALFAQELTVTQASDADDKATPGTSAPPFYVAFAHDADLKGSSYAKICRSLLGCALVKRRAILALDMPRPEMLGEITTKADEEALGADRAYVYEVPVEQLIDWEYDDFGGFSFAILHRHITSRASPEAKRGGDTVREWKVWRMVSGPDGAPVAAYQTYRISTKPNESLHEETIIPLIEDESDTTSFKEIPLIELCVPDGLWVGNKIGPLAKEHLSRRCALVGAENRSLVTIPYVKLGSEIGAPGGALPAERATDPSRGDGIKQKFERRGNVVLGKDDELGFAEPTGRAYDLVDKQLAALKDEMFRVVERMAASVDNSSSSMRRSGQSKKQDREPEAIVLGAMGQAVRDFTKHAYDAIAQARGDKVIWTVHGLDNFDGTDRQQLLDEATKMSMVPIPSPTFRKSYAAHVALKLVPNLPPETQEIIREEIESGVDAEEEIRTLQQEAQKDQIENPTPPASVVAPGAPVSNAPQAPSPKASKSAKRHDGNK